MPIIDIEENINKLRMNIEQGTQEICLFQGMLQTFEGFKASGLKTIQLPHDPTQDVDELESIQEKPE